MRALPYYDHPMLHTTSRHPPGTPLSASCSSHYDTFNLTRHGPCRPITTLPQELPNSLGPTPMAATPRHPSLAFPADTPARLSTISWGDAHLLTRGSPRNTLAALATAATATSGRRSPQRRRRAASAGANARLSPSNSLPHSQSPAQSAQSGPGAFYYYEGQGRMSTGQLLIHGSSRMGRMRRVSLSAPTSPVKAGDAPLYRNGTAMEDGSDMAGGRAGLVRSVSGGFAAGEPSFYPGGGSLAASMQGGRPRTAPTMQTVPEEERSFQAGGGAKGGEASARASYYGGAGAGQVWVNPQGVMGTPGRSGGGAVGAGGGEHGGGEDEEEEGREEGGGGRVRGKLSRFPTFSVGVAGRGEGGDAQRPWGDGGAAEGGESGVGESGGGSTDGAMGGQHRDLFWAGAQGSAQGVDLQQGEAMGFATAGFGGAPFGVQAPQTGSVPLPGFSYPSQGRVSEVLAGAAASAAAGQVPGLVAIDGESADWWVDTGRGGVLAAPLVSRVGRAVDAAAAAIAAAAGAAGTEPGVRQQPGAWEHAAVAAVKAAAATAAAAAVAVAAEAGQAAPVPAVWETQGQGAWPVGASAKGLDLPSSGGGHGSSAGVARGQEHAAAVSGGGASRSADRAGGRSIQAGIGAEPLQGKGQDPGVLLPGAATASTIPAHWQQQQQQQPFNNVEPLPTAPGAATLQQWLLYQQQQARTAQLLDLQQQLPALYAGQYLHQQAPGQPLAQRVQQQQHVQPLPQQKLPQHGQALGGLPGQGHGWPPAGGVAVGVDAMSDAARQAAFLSMLQQQQEQQGLGFQAPDDHSVGAGKAWKMVFRDGRQGAFVLCRGTPAYAPLSRAC